MVSALALVYGIAHLLNTGGGAPQPTGTTVGRLSSPSPTRTSTPVHQTKPSKPHNDRTVLTQPTGPCRAADLVVTPSVKGTAYAGRLTTFRLSVTSMTSVACTWGVSARSLVVKLTSGTDPIWSTQDCPSAVPHEQVVVRTGLFTTVFVRWDGQRSQGRCSRATPWALPGYYHVTAAALGANPVDQQFQLYRPVPATITAKPKPRKHPSGSPSPSASATKKSG